MPPFVQSDNVTLVGSNGAEPSIATAPLTDARSYSVNAMEVLATIYGDSGVSRDKWRSNIVGTILPSLARTATAVSPTQTNYNGTSLLVLVDVTTPGTGQLTPTVRYAGTAGPVNLFAPPAITIAGKYLYILGPGEGAVTGAITAAASHMVPRLWDFGIGHSDVSSWTYGVYFALNV